ncbi:MAG: type I DNA topoisomerase [Chloroflexi bacterium]|jgi:DNA topoisomerase-1|nr:type I DNA topoisomerase [Chloroflexota bacterium]
MAVAAKKLVIVESPAKAKTIEKFLGRGYAVKASLGHVRDLPKRRLGVDLEDGFSPSYVVPTEKKELVKELATLARGASELLLATDPDREGEAIAWHLLQAVQQKGKPPIPARRVVFHEITRTAVQEALRHPREIDLNLVKAQQGRRVIDRLVGYKLSPLLWNKVRKGLSAGRVQSVAVRLIVDREREVEKFVPVEYWTVEALVKCIGRVAQRGKVLRDTMTLALVQRDGEKLELGNGEITESVVADLRRSTYVVADVRQRQQVRNPAAPFITSTMQQDAGRRLGFTAKRTMTVAQQLYEGLEVPGEGTIGLITYMRTDSPQVAKEAQDEVRGLIAEKFGAEYVPAQPPVYKTRAKGAQEAHEAIRPTSSLRLPETLRPHLTSDQYRLYSLVWKRFVASQMLGATYDTVAVDVVARPEGVAEGGSPTYTLRANGSILRFAGFLKVLDAVEGDGEEADKRSKLLPEVTVGEALALETVDGTQHFTQPPPRFSEATLIKALEEDGIGRPSTYAPILSTIQEREYVKRIERVLRPTDLGMIVNDLLVEHFPDVVDAGFTAHIEGQLDQVADGEGDWVPVVDQFYKPFAENLEKARDLMERVEIADEPSDETCDLCERPMVIKTGRYGKFLACSGFPECRNTRTLVTRIGVPCPDCGGDLLERKSRRGRMFYGCINYPTCTFASWQRPVPEPCPVDGKMQTIQAGGKVVCTVCGHVTIRVRQEEDLPVDPGDDEGAPDADAEEAPALVAASA